MIHPLVDDLSQYSDGEIDEKIRSLQSRYFKTGNPDLQHQIVVMLDIYREEAQVRRQRQFEQMQQNEDSGLDGLINIS